MIEPKDKDIDGKIYVLSKFDAIAGRKIVTQYITSGVPKIGNYDVNESIMFQLMAHVSAYTTAGTTIQLTTPDLIRNHVPNWEVLGKIEMAMMEYNCSFFHNGRLSTFLNDTAQKVPAWISKILTVLSERSSPTEKPPLTS